MNQILLQGLKESCDGNCTRNVKMRHYLERAIEELRDNDFNHAYKYIEAVNYILEKIVNGEKIE